MASCPSLLPTPSLKASFSRGTTPSCKKWSVDRISAHSSNRGSMSTDATCKDYYEILGVSVDASYEEIRRAYRLLQKKHHPDIAGPEGHEITLLLNEAYQTLTSSELRHAYRFSSSRNNNTSGENKGTFYTGYAYSAWNGPDRSQAIFVDENSCIGCRECVYHATKTFSMDESCGSARVTCQWGDPDPQIKVALEACPVNCIHYVEKDDLPILEYFMRPQPKASNGVYGGGWERPSNVFMAAKTFKRKINADSKLNESWRSETPAQRKARTDADLKMKAGAFWWLWSWGMQNPEPVSGTKQESNSWFGLFGRSCTSHIFRLPVSAERTSKIVEVIQEWAMTFASSSELPLPLPFKADLLENGVRLTLVSASNGVVESKGSLLVTLKEEDDANFISIEREGITGTGALPGERTIIQHLKDAVNGHEKSYASYRIPRPSV